jgi:hypothetical protein
MQVELLTNGGFCGTDACIGKVFTVVEQCQHGAVELPVCELLLAGAEPKELEGCITLHFYAKEVRVLDES